MKAGSSRSWRAGLAALIGAGDNLYAYFPFSSSWRTAAATATIASGLAHYLWSQFATNVGTAYR